MSLFWCSHLAHVRWDIAYPLGLAGVLWHNKCEHSLTGSGVHGGETPYTPYTLFRGEIASVVGANVVSMKSSDQDGACDSRAFSLGSVYSWVVVLLGECILILEL